MKLPLLHMTQVPVATVAQMRAFDQHVVETWQLPVPVLMENAARAVATIARLYGKTACSDMSVMVLAGKGNNGGDGLGAARYLSNWGAHVTAVTTHSADALHPAPAQHYQILQGMDVSLHMADTISRSDMDSVDIIIDALLGFTVQSPPREPAASLISMLSQSDATVIAVDIPSGLDADTGDVNSPATYATATVSLAAVKQGLCTDTGQSIAGDIFVADIGAPAAAYTAVDIPYSYPFAYSDIVQLA